MSGKGSSPRPFAVDGDTYAANWDAIFGKAANDDRQEKPQDEAPEADGEA